MKNLTAFGIFLLMLALLFSCVKEADITTTGEPEVIPQEGETKLLTGLVRDTAGTVLPKASVKIVLEGLEIETEADENGEWNLTIPNSLTEGFIVANKVEYSKSIQRYNETGDKVIKDIYLARDPSNTELDLGFEQGNLKTVVGRIIDDNANPIPDVLLFLFSVLESPQMEYVFNGSVVSAEDGSFEIIYEDLGFSYSTLFTLFSGGCSDNLYFDVPNEDPIEDLGDLELSYENFSVFQTSLLSDGSSCYDNVRTLAYVYDLEAAFTENNYDQPLGDISLDYCLNEDGAVYIGVESEDNTHFNGLFVSPTEAETSYMFDICTPNPGIFLELNINGNVEVYEDNLVFENPRTVVSQNTDAQLNFRVLNWVTFTPSGSINPAYQIGKIKSLTLATNGVEFDLDEESSVNYVNIVQDDDNFYAGIIKAQLSTNDGSTADMSIRFRVAK